MRALWQVRHVALLVLFELLDGVDGGVIVETLGLVDAPVCSLRKEAEDVVSVLTARSRDGAPAEVTSIFVTYVAHYYHHLYLANKVNCTG